MTDNIAFSQLLSLPSSGFDSSKVFESLGKQNFMLIYDIKHSVSILGFDSTLEKYIKLKINKEILGIELMESDELVFDEKESYTAFSVYRKIDKFDGKIFSDIFDVLPKKDFLSILFVYTGTEEINSKKVQLENMLSAKDVKETESSLRIRFSNKMNLTTHRDLYYESEEKIMLNSVIESLNKAVLTNGLGYKIFLIVPKNAQELHDYINTHFLVLAKYNFYRNNIKFIIDQLSKKSCLPFGVDYAKEFLNFYGFYKVNHTLATSTPLEEVDSDEKGIDIGTFIKEGVSETDIKIKINRSVINLGFIITGLPGSGKTREAMSILDSVISNDKNEKTVVFIITPTKEWRDFALTHEMFFIKLYDDNTPINFFRCPETIEVAKFYNNLAMILSAAANAGPYRNPMEKCMINAFRKVYVSDLNPDPITVYNEIEESIIRYHGKRTSLGIKYTKHGENIKSALENLRGIICRQEYCVKDGVHIEDLEEKGAVFDVSSTGGNTMTQLYALILNQIYAIAANFDNNGDNELRLIICLEEAQTIFKDPDSPAVEDIKQRIQDFRKYGIGLMLLTHNVTDIDIGIRRLCQLKLYLKQAADTALIASKDLIFANVEQDDVILKLKTLDSRLGAFSYVSKKGNEKIQQDTIFVKTEVYDNRIEGSFNNPIIDYINKYDLKITKLINCKIIVKSRVNKEVKNIELKSNYFIRLDFLGEEKYLIESNSLNSYNLTLLENKEYTMCLLGRNGRVVSRSKFISKSEVEVFID